MKMQCGNNHHYDLRVCSYCGSDVCYDNDDKPIDDHWYSLEIKQSISKLKAYMMQKIIFKSIK
jgi:hypothetical protein